MNQLIHSLSPVAKKEDGSHKVTVYMKDTHTYQYLHYMYSSHHPLQHRLGVVRTLHKRTDNRVTASEDQKKEIEHVNNALSNWMPLMVFQRDQTETSKQGRKIEG